MPHFKMKPKKLNLKSSTDLKKQAQATLLAGRLAFRARLVILSTPENRERRIKEMEVALNEYDTETLTNL